ncbi:LysR family transcriptional regulator [Kaustia mangrovi]|uniref:LysR family transcriptional regulator n=1 Tax=Kaustia mangrovi TaxID=2593653 RepID=A0A7S8C5I2_9HYPH|nr:LysR substrate-binding domain-containing protein [Kaustia mangrovi]QPC43579.1 LysR family transcriptional regulator [Kaustia mangrovi]
MKIERKNDLSLRHLEVFGAVMRCQTMVGAAYELGVSQPAVSTTIKQLEAQLGFTLFERENRRLMPTEEARALYSEVEPVFMMMRSIEKRVRDLRDTSAGTLRIIATPPLANTVAPAALKRFLADRPGVSVTYDIRYLDSVIEAVEIGAADIGLLLGLEQHPAVTMTPIHECGMVCLLPPGHPLCEREVVTPADTVGHPLIGLYAESRLGALLRASFYTMGVPFTPVVEVRYCHSAAVLANAGIGIAIVDEFTADFTRTYEVRQRPFAPQTRVIASYLTRRDGPGSRLAEAFADELKAVLAEREATARANRDTAALSAPAFTLRTGEL